MAQIGLRQAARLSGRNQSTLHRAMKAGKMSYTVDEAGQRRIDTAELDRVFGPLARGEGFGSDQFDVGSHHPSAQFNGASAASSAHALQSNTAHAAETAALERLLADREASIADLRQRLDASEAERRQLSERLTAVLTDQRAGKFPTVGNLQAGEPAAAKGYGALTVSSPARAGEPRAGTVPRSPLAFRAPWWRRWFR